jgi:hypothetical protein
MKKDIERGKERDVISPGWGGRGGANVTPAKKAWSSIIELYRY